MSPFGALKNRYIQVLKKEPEPINQTKIRILAVSILSFIGLCTSLLLLYAFQEHAFMMIRLNLFLALYITSFLLLLYKSSWKVGGHFFVLSLTVLIWSGTFLFKQTVNIVTIQQTLLVLTIGYYTLGEKWGTIYSFVNIFPILALLILQIYFPSFLGAKPFNVNNISFIIAIVFNFLLLLYIHYTFFKAFKISNQEEQKLKSHLQRSVLAAEELAAAKTNFLSTMSHELRTPLNAVIGMTNILMVEDPKPEQIENLNILYFSAENLMGTINDILDFNKIDSSTIILSEDVFSVEKLMTNVYGTFKAKAKEKGIDFKCTSPSLKSRYVIGDHARLAQVLFNLVGNAIKYTAQGYVLMNAGIVNETEDRLTIQFTVEDTGIGIPQERQERVFEPFTQIAHRTNRQYHGTGLGLTIANRLIKLHDGDLKLYSTEGKGTTFVFEISYAIAKNGIPPEVKPIPQTSSLKNLRVLVAEDEPINVMVIRKILEKWEIKPEVAVNGHEALQAVMQHDYDIVLMDINMPVMDGFEASRRIRELNDPLKSGIAIIAVTASLEAALEQISTFKYIDDCILKPFRPEHLKEKLEQVAAKKA